LPRLEELKAHIRITRPVIRELAKFKSLKVLDPSQPFPARESDLGQELRTANPNLRVHQGQWLHPN
jgi:hypothetical protein